MAAGRTAPGRASRTRLTSVRARTTLAASLVVGVTLVVGAIGLLLTLEHSLTSNRDELSQARAADLAQQAADGTLPRRLVDLGDNSVGQVVDDAGNVVAATPGLLRSGPISSFSPGGSAPELVTLRNVPDDTETESYRVWALRAGTPTGDVTVFVGASPESVTEAVATVRRSLVIGIPAVLALLALSTGLLVGRALKPVEDIRTEVAAISDAAVDRRVPVPATGDEIERLATTMNDMLGRLEASANRQRDFIADASHELQSPLTAFRAQLEVAQAHPDGVDWPALTTDLLGDSDRMERLVRDLLFLAKQDAAQPGTADEPVDLDDLVLEEVARLHPRPGLDIDTARTSAAPLRGRRDELARLVRNLLENASRHARSHITVALSESASQVCLEISDDGPGIGSGDRERVFERFARVESARERSHGGTGLGLSIAKAIAERHRGT
ncbi:MAG: HAMP domain-containing histidine kinase, partial [Propionibacteriales bacterium]|nr:HAMP domain-containing histidine kinase [Propionibacteriales bacterium]